MREFVFQQIWKREAASSKGYITLCNHRFTVISPGEHNSGDGPDFKNAKLMFEDGTLLAGDIELHLAENEWYVHNHHTDEAYNAVILHVFLHGGSRPAAAQSGNRPLRLDYSPYMKASIVRKSQEDAGLPCSAGLHYISQKALSHQFEKAQKEYFSSRITKLMSFWEAGQTIQVSFDKMLFVALAEGLGIERNRRPLHMLAELAFDEVMGVKNVSAIEAILLKKSGLTENEGVLSRQEWDLSGSRPGNKPKDRIHQLSVLALNLQEIPRSVLLSSPDAYWQRLVAGTGSGKRMELLMHIVWFPAIYILGSVIHSKRFCTLAYKGWESQQISIPSFVAEEFKRAGFPSGVLEPHLGMVHQFKRYCRAGECGRCEIGQKLGIA